MDNAEKGIEAACKATGAQISDYTAAPIFYGFKCQMSPSMANRIYKNAQ